MTSLFSKDRKKSKLGYPYFLNGHPISPLRIDIVEPGIACIIMTLDVKEEQGNRVRELKRKVKIEDVSGYLEDFEADPEGTLQDIYDSYELIVYPIPIKKKARERL